MITKFVGCIFAVILWTVPPVYGTVQQERNAQPVTGADFVEAISKVKGDPEGTIAQKAQTLSEQYKFKVPDLQNAVTHALATPIFFALVMDGQNPELPIEEMEKRLTNDWGIIVPPQVTAPDVVAILSQIQPGSSRLSQLGAVFPIPHEPTAPVGLSSGQEVAALLALDTPERQVFSDPTTPTSDPLPDPDPGPVVVIDPCETVSPTVGCTPQKPVTMRA